MEAQEIVRTVVKIIVEGAGAAVGSIAAREYDKIRSLLRELTGRESPPEDDLRKLSENDLRRLHLLLTATPNSKKVRIEQYEADELTAAQKGPGTKEISIGTAVVHGKGTITQDD